MLSTFLVCSRITSILQDKSVGGVLICSRDHAASLIDPDSGIRKSTVPLFEAVEDGVLLPDGSLVTVGEEGKLKQWSVRGTKLLRSSQLTTLLVFDWLESSGVSS